MTDFPEDYWPEDDRAPEQVCAEDGCCYCMYPGDVDYVGEPDYGWGLVVACCCCGETRVDYNDHLNHDCAAEWCWVGELMAMVEGVQP